MTIKNFTERNRMSKEVRECNICGDSFIPKAHNSQACKKAIQFDCLYCLVSIETVCSRDKKKYCDSSCRNKFTRKYKYAIKEQKKCKICHETFKPANSNQYVCSKNHSKNCSFCEEIYSPATSSRYFTESNLYCDNICSTFAQTNSNIAKSKIKEYKDIDNWAQNFKNKNDRKPTEADFRAYFNVRRLPRLYSSNLFMKKADSRFEIIVINFIQEKFPEISIKRRHRKKIDSKILEIDIYLEDLKLGFEVQDFKTHSKESNTEPDPFANFKKGPEYHLAKISGYAKQNISIIEIWEDEIISGDFKKTVLLEISNRK